MSDDTSSRTALLQTGRWGANQRIELRSDSINLLGAKQPDDSGAGLSQNLGLAKYQNLERTNDRIQIFLRQSRMHRQAQHLFRGLIRIIQSLASVIR